MQENYLYDEYAMLQALGMIGRDVDFDEWLTTQDIF